MAHAISLYHALFNYMMPTEINLLREELGRAVDEERRVADALDEAEKVVKRYRKEGNVKPSVLTAVENYHETLKSNHADAAARVRSIMSRLEGLGHCMP